MPDKLTRDMLRYMTVTGATEAQARSMLVGVTEFDFQECTNDNLRDLDRAIQTEVMVLAAEAKKIADNFYAWQKDMNAELTDRNKSTNLIARAVLKGNSLSIVWQYQLKRKTPGPGKTTAISRVLKPNAKYGYSEQQWQKLPDWIRGQVINTEAKFKIIRERYERLSMVRAAVTNYKWAVKKDRNQKGNSLGIRCLDVPTLKSNTD